MPTNKKSTSEYDSQREIRVLLEQIVSEVKAVAEQQRNIIKILEAMAQRSDRFDNALMENKNTFLR